MDHHTTDAHRTLAWPRKERLTRAGGRGREQRLIATAAGTEPRPPPTGKKRPPNFWWPRSFGGKSRVLQLESAARNPTTGSQSASLICVKTCHSLVPAS